MGKRYYVGPKYLKWFYDIDWAGWSLVLGITIFVLGLIFGLSSICHGWN